MTSAYKVGLVLCQGQGGPFFLSPETYNLVGYKPMMVCSSKYQTGDFISCQAISCYNLIGLQLDFS